VRRTRARHGVNSSDAADDDLAAVASFLNQLFEPDFDI
jgi:hypothetical protein